MTGQSSIVSEPPIVPDLNRDGLDDDLSKLGTDDNDLKSSEARKGLIDLLNEYDDYFTTTAKDGKPNTEIVQEPEIIQVKNDREEKPEENEDSSNAETKQNIIDAFANSLFESLEENSV